jgi:hypothetical protein
MTAPDAFGYVIFCDDVRYEVGGKLTLIGVYQSLLYVYEDFPTSLNKLVLSIHYSERLGIDLKPTSIRISIPGEPEDAPGIVAELPMAEIRRSPMPSLGEDLGLPPPKFLQVGTQVVLGALQLKSPGLISVTARRGDEIIHLGNLRILRAPTTAANQIAA